MSSGRAGRGGRGGDRGRPWTRGRGNHINNTTRAGSPSATTSAPTAPSASRGQRGDRARGNNTFTRGAGNTRGRGQGPRAGGNVRGRGNIMSPSTVSSNGMSNTTPIAQNDYKSRFEYLKADRPRLRAQLVKEKKMNPDGPMRLQDAVPHRGTCQDMCPEFERVRRIVENDLKKPEYTAESLALNDRRQRVPDESRMVKAFQRSAAGMDVELVTDIRSPAACLKTMRYLAQRLDQEPFEDLHGWVWDRTRAIRNDLTKQSISGDNNLELELQCYEENARLLLLSLHHMSASNKEDYSHQQDREQLHQTMMSIRDRHLDNRRAKRVSANWVEFLAYRLVLSRANTGSRDLQWELNNLPELMKGNRRLQTAVKITQAADTIVPHASLNAARQNWRAFWELVRSPATSYLLACAAELVFPHVRRLIINTLHKAYRQGGPKHRIRTEDWTVGALQEVLGFDSDAEVVEYCELYGFKFERTSAGDLYLDTTSVEFTGARLEEPDEVKPQTFSWTYVENKRHDRLLSAVIRGMSVKQARNQRLILDSPLTGPTEDLELPEVDTGDSLFVPEVTSQATVANPTEGSTLFTQTKPAEAAPTFNPSANPFKPLGDTTDQANGSTSGSPFPKPGTTFSNPFASGAIGSNPASSNPFASGAAGAPATSSNPFASSPINSMGIANGASSGFGKPSGLQSPASTSTTTAATSNLFTTSPATGEKVQPGLFNASADPIKFSNTNGSSSTSNFDFSGSSLKSLGTDPPFAAMPTKGTETSAAPPQEKAKDTNTPTSFFSSTPFPATGATAAAPAPQLSSTLPQGGFSFTGSPFATTSAPSAPTFQAPAGPKKVSFAEDAPQQKEKDEQERKAREEHERRAREEQERKAKLAQEQEQRRLAQEEAAKLVRQEQVRKAREEQQRVAEKARLEGQRKRQKEVALDALTEQVFMDPSQGLLMQYIEQQVMAMAPEVMMAVQKEKAVKRAEEMYEQKKKQTLFGYMQLWTSKLGKKRLAKQGQQRRKRLRESKAQLTAAEASSDRGIEEHVKSRPIDFKKPQTPASASRMHKRSSTTSVIGARVEKRSIDKARKSKVSKAVDQAFTASNGVNHAESSHLRSSSIDGTSLSVYYNRSTQPIDRTETDWFKLRAQGMDPATIRKRNHDSASEGEEEPEMGIRKRVRTSATPSIRSSPRTSLPPTNKSDDVLARFRAFKESQIKSETPFAAKSAHERSVIEKARTLLSRDPTPQHSPPNVQHEFSRSVPDLTSVPYGPGRFGSPTPTNKPAYWARKSRFVPQHLYGKGGEAVRSFLSASRGSNSTTSNPDPAPLELSSPIPTQQSYAIDTQDRYDLEDEPQAEEAGAEGEASTDGDDEDEEMSEGEEYSSGEEDEAEGEYEEDYEGDGYEEEDGYQSDDYGDADANLSYKLQYSSQQHAQYVSRGNTPGATQDDAIELSD